MNREIAMAWADNLESGNYSQVTGALKALRPDNKMGFCCLGALCDQSKHGEWIERNNSHNFVQINHQYLGSKCTLPDLVKNWAGMRTETGRWEGDPVTDRCLPIDDDGEVIDNLAGLNDAGWTFPEIAKFIRDNWQLL